MNEITALLAAFGFTAKDAKIIAEKAHENGLDQADVQAWIDEAQASRSLYNPLGFVRLRIQDGDRLTGQAAAGRHHADRQRYKTLWDPTSVSLHGHFNHATRTCECGRVVYATRFCPECDLCPTCCECQPAGPDEE